MTTTTETAHEAGLVEMMTARYPGRCRLCGGGIKVGKEIGYARAAKMTFCWSCVSGGSRFAASTTRTEEIRAMVAGATTVPASATRLSDEEREDRGDYSQRGDVVRRCPHGLSSGGGRCTPACTRAPHDD